MEEILASIRRIIADDDANKTAQREAEAPKPAVAIEAAPEPSPPVAAPPPSAAEIRAEPALPAASPAPVFEAAAEAARRALLKCSPLHLPPDKYDTWKSTTFRFNPSGMLG